MNKELVKEISRGLRYGDRSKIAERLGISVQRVHETINKAKIETPNADAILLEASKIINDRNANKKIVMKNISKALGK